MTAKHTPAPWWVTDSGVRDRGGYICHTNPAQRYEGQDERFAEETVERTANKLLIAAAPEVLAKLHDLEVAANTVAYCYDKRPENFAVALQSLQDVAAQARELIAKATGEAP